MSQQQKGKYKSVKVYTEDYELIRRAQLKRSVRGLPYMSMTKLLRKAIELLYERI